MLDFKDAPYRFYPAKPNPFIMWIGSWLNRKFFLPGVENRVEGVEVSGAIEAVRDLKKNGKRILFIPNHSTQSDPYLMMEVQRQLGVPSCFMAAYDVFLDNGPFRAWVMQQIGCFSVDRDSSDSRAMKAALDVMTRGKYALTIFPEGNVYLTNDRVTPFLEGAAFLAFKAQKELGEDEPIHAVPVSIKLTHLADVRSKVMDRLRELAREAETELDGSAPPLAELARIGSLHVTEALRERGYLKNGDEITADGGDLHEKLLGVAAEIIGRLEEKMDLSARPKDDVTTRFRKVRSAIHQIRVDPEKSTKHRVAAAWADEAILALRILGYSEPYVAENPTLDRFSETVTKLVQDVYSEPQNPIGDRKALVEVGAPVALPDRFAAASGKMRNAARDLTAELEASVQAGLDAINARNDFSGSETF
ncbi:MAG: 1-acyl-sn-glycerol-3-phosphate acyltransferase [Verrucomicrobiota bacterium]